MSTGRLADWKISGDAILYSGFPITLTSTNVSNTNNGTARPNQYHKLVIQGRTLHHWFGTSAAATPCSGASNGTCAYGSEIINPLWYGQGRRSTRSWLPYCRYVNVQAVPYLQRTGHRLPCRRLQCRKYRFLFGPGSSGHYTIYSWTDHQHSIAGTSVPILPEVHVLIGHA